jgi:hypothetical protein
MANNLDTATHNIDYRALETGVLSDNAGLSVLLTFEMLTTVRLIPQPPGRGASKRDALLYWRRLSLFGLTMLLPILIVGLVFSSTFVLIVAAAAALWQLAMLSINLVQLRREHQRSA